MKIKDYVYQLRQLGLRLHKSNGIWWQQISPFYCTPANEFAVFGAADNLPRFSESLVGYKFFVTEENLATSTSSYMFRDWDAGKIFDINDLSSKKRNQVRKGQKLCDIRPLESLEQFWPDLQRINVSNSERTRSGYSPQYYVKNYVKWQKDMRLWHALDNRMWLGAFVEGTLAAYFYGYAIEETYTINAAKSDTAFLKCNPNDALLFRMLEHALNTEKCTRVFYGDFTPTNLSLSKFKEQFGFSRQEFYIHRRFRQPFDIMLKVQRTVRSSKLSALPGQ